MTIFRFSTVFLGALAVAACSREPSSEHLAMAEAIGNLQTSVDELSLKVEELKDVQSSAGSATGIVPPVVSTPSPFEPDHSDLDRKLDKIESDVEEIQRKLIFMQ